MLCTFTPAKKLPLLLSCGYGFECFLPRYKSIRKWSDRLKEVEQPLFPSYLFCRFDLSNRRPIVMTPGVMQIVGNGRNAVSISDEEISTIQVAVSAGSQHQPWPYIEVGERVRIIHGTLSGVEGILINFKGSHRVVLSVTLLQRSVALEVDAAWLVPAREKERVTVNHRGFQPSPSGSLIPSTQESKI